MAVNFPNHIRPASTPIPQYNPLPTHLVSYLRRQSPPPSASQPQTPTDLARRFGRVFIFPYPERGWW